MVRREPGIVKDARQDLRLAAPALMVAILGFGVATFTHADPDLWGHLRFGLDSLATWTLPDEDPYSFTQDRPWLNHEWLSEAVMATAFRAAGTVGLVLLKAALVTAVFAFVWAALRRASWWARLATLAWLAFASVHMLSTLRPQLWSFLGVAILVRALLAHPSPKQFLLPLLFALWANMHGGWIVGMNILVAWAIGRSREGLRSWFLVIACGAATLCTPYGLDLLRFLRETVQFERTITEWRPLWEGASTMEWAAWLGTSAISAAAIATAGDRRLARALMLALLAWAALRVMRVGSLYAVTACLCAAPQVAARWPARRRSASAAGFHAQRGPILFLPIAAALLAAARLTAVASSCIPSTGPWSADPSAVPWLRSAPPGRLVTTFDWGQYAIWHLGPRITVSLDGRRETVYSQAHLIAHDEVIAGTPEGLATLDRWSPDYLWLPEISPPLRRWLEVRHYSVINAKRSLVASKVPLVAPPVPAAIRPCFPE